MLLLGLRGRSALALELLALRLSLLLALLTLLLLSLLLAWLPSPWAPGASLTITTLLGRRAGVVIVVYIVVSAGVVDLLALAGTRILVLDARPVSPWLLTLALALTLLSLALLSPAARGSSLLLLSLLLALLLLALALLLALLSGNARASGASLANGSLGGGVELLFTGGGLSAGFRNFDVNLAAVDVLVVQEGDRFLGILSAGEFDEAITEGTGSAGNDVSTEYVTGNAELVAKFLGADFEGQVTNENFGGHFLQ